MTPEELKEVLDLLNQMWRQSVYPMRDRIARVIRPVERDYNLQTTDYVKGVRADGKEI